MISESFRQPNGFKLVCYTATLCTTMRVDSNRRLAHLSSMRGAGGHDLLISDGSCKSRLLGQRPLSCEQMLIRAAGIYNLHSSHDHCLKQEWHAGPVL